MPFKSDAQRKFFNANRAKLEKQGVDVDESNASSKGAKLPERKHEYSRASYKLARKKKRSVS